MSEETNPYAPPSAPLAEAITSRAALRELVLGWEKSRLLFNGILLLPGIGVLGVGVTQGLSVPWAILMGLFGGIGANGAFFLGPLAELYFRGLVLKGEPSPFLRKILLMAGFFVSFGAMGVCAIGFLTT